MLHFCAVNDYFHVINRVFFTRLVSAAGTGYYYTFRKVRGKERKSLMKYDPVGKRPIIPRIHCRVLNTHTDQDN